MLNAGSLVLISDLLQTARYKAQTAGCAYVYDYPTLFEESIKQIWNEHAVDRPKDFFSYVELILDSTKKGKNFISQIIGVHLRPSKRVLMIL